jgi:hypothetical protein
MHACFIIGVFICLSAAIYREATLREWITKHFYVILYREMLDVAKLGLRKHHEDNVAWQRAFLIHAFLSPPYYL